ncbi:MAG: DUF1554 domain-containing protein [Candidatus Paceibacterota bacterium]|jgi:type II secretory pathway pseudopilin PulG
MRIYKQNKGFTLTEVLIYVGILAISTGIITGIMTTVTKTQVEQSAENELSGQLNFVMNTIQRLVKESSVIEIGAGASTDSLVLRMKDTTTSTIYLSGGQIYIREGNNSAQALTNEKVVVDSLEFKKLTQYPGKDVVQIDLALSSAQDVGGNNVTRSLRSAVSRASAATFDSDLLPGTDNSYSVGINPTRWKNAAFSGNVGIGVSTLINKLDVAGGAAIGSSYAGASTAPSNGLIVQGNVGIGTTAPSYSLETAGGIKASSTSVFTVGNSGDKVVIGTSTSAAYKAKLDVAGSVLSARAPYNFGYWWAEGVSSEPQYGFSSSRAKSSFGNEDDEGYAVGWFGRASSAVSSLNDMIFYGRKNVQFLLTDDICLGNPCIAGYQVLSDTSTLTLDLTNSKVGIGLSSSTLPTEALEVKGNIKLTGATPTYKLTNLAAPTADSDATTKAYVDAAVASGSATTTLTKRVFVTSALYDGNLGGVSGAHAKCQARANAASLGGTWEAIIGQYSTTVEPITTIGYNWIRLINMGGYVVADSSLATTTSPYVMPWVRFDGTNYLMNKVEYDENGTLVNDYVWTDFDFTGLYKGASDCSNWTTNSAGGYGAYGYTNTAIGGWAYTGIEACNLTNRLYCIEQ